MTKPQSVVPSTGPLTSDHGPAESALSLNAQFEQALHALTRYSQADTDRFTETARQQLRGEGREPVLRPLVIRAALIAAAEERAALEQLETEPDPRLDTDADDGDDPARDAPYPDEYPDDHPDLHEYADEPDYDEGLEYR